MNVTKLSMSTQVTENVRPLMAARSTFGPPSTSFKMPALEAKVYRPKDRGTQVCILVDVGGLDDPSMMSFGIDVERFVPVGSLVGTHAGTPPPRTLMADLASLFESIKDI